MFSHEKPKKKEFASKFFCWIGKNKYHKKKNKKKKHKNLKKMKKLRIF